jgi:hypothetical protein
MVAAMDGCFNALKRIRRLFRLEEQDRLVRAGAGRRLRG